MDKYCSNWLCEAEAVVEVPVHGESESTRSLCACCKESYDIGVYHGEQLNGACPDLLAAYKKAVDSTRDNEELFASDMVTDLLDVIVKAES